MTSSSSGRTSAAAHRVARPLSAAVLALAVAVPAGAQTSTSVDSLVHAFQAEHQVPGMAIGILRPDGDTIITYGVTMQDGGVPVGAHTSFEIGSIAKVFTGLLLAEMAVRGDVGLDDPLAQYLPEGANAPASGNGPIRLRHLANHTSGLPRLPGNLVPADLADPYAAYTAEDLYAFLSGHQLARAPGAAYEYSNLGAGLLGNVLARRAELPFASLMRSRVLAPLGLDATHVTPADLPDGSSARGHAQGRPVQDWDFGPLAGAGGMRGTPADLLRFLRVQLQPDASPLAGAVRLSRAKVVPATPPLGVALGWHVLPMPGTEGLYWHNGGTGGFRSFAGFVPDRDVAVVVLANAAAPLPQFDLFALQVLGSVLREGG